MVSEGATYSPRPIRPRISASARSPPCGCGTRSASVGAAGRSRGAVRCPRQRPKRSPGGGCGLSRSGSLLDAASELLQQRSGDVAPPGRRGADFGPVLQLPVALSTERGTRAVSLPPLSAARPYSPRARGYYPGSRRWPDRANPKPRPTASGCSEGSVRAFGGCRSPWDEACSRHPGADQAVHPGGDRPPARRSSPSTRRHRLPPDA